VSLLTSYSMEPVVEEFNQLLRWLQPDIGGGRPGFGTNQRGQASSLQCAECVFVSLVIAEIGDSGVRVRFRQNGADGIAFIAARNPDLQAAIEFKQGKWIFRNQGQPEVADFGLDLDHFVRRQPSPMNGNASRLYFSLRIELDGLKKLGGKREPGLLLKWNLADFIAAVGFETFETMASPNFRIGIDPNETHYFACGAAADENNACSCFHDAHQPLGNIRIRQCQAAIHGKRRERAVVIEQEYTGRSGPELIQKSRVRDLTLECLHAGS